MYVLKWKEFFPQKDLKYPPSFDGRAVCYPSSDIIQDYLAWRQVDCEYSYYIYFLEDALNFEGFILLINKSDFFFQIMCLSLIFKILL